MANEVTLDISAQLEVHDLSQDFPTICRKWDDDTCHEVAQLTGCQKMSRETLEAYGHRLVACWNTCRGIPTDDLQRVRFYQPADGNWPIRFVDTDGIIHVPCEITARHSPVLREEQSEPCSPAEPS